jgi:hypothetical protein
VPAKTIAKESTISGHPPVEIPTDRARVLNVFIQSKYRTIRKKVLPSRDTVAGRNDIASADAASKTTAPANGHRSANLLLSIQPATAHSS